MPLVVEAERVFVLFDIVRTTLTLRVVNLTSKNEEQATIDNMLLKGVYVIVFGATCRVIFFRFNGLKAQAGNKLDAVPIWMLLAVRLHYLFRLLGA